MFTRAHQIYSEVIRRGILRLEWEDDRPTYVYNYDEEEPHLSGFVRTVLEQGPSSATELYVLGSLLHEGPKFFEFTTRDCEALENFDLSLPCEDYCQPFPTLMIKLPKDYAKNRVVPFSENALRMEGGEHYPQDIVVRHDPSFKRVSLLYRMSSSQAITRVVGLEFPTVEDAWKESCTTWGQTLPMTGPETELGDALTRLGLAACTLLMVYGSRKVGFDNPSYADRLVKYVQKAKKTKDKKRIQETSWDLHVLPVRYEFAQQVKLYERASPENKSDCPLPTGRVLEPHWRRGHFRMQAYGPNYSLHKRIAVPPILVNAHLFLGESSAGSVTYTK